MTRGCWSIPPTTTVASQEAAWCSGPRGPSSRNKGSDACCFHSEIRKTQHLDVNKGRTSAWHCMVNGYFHIPSGKRLHNYIRKITMLLMGKSTLSMGHFPFRFRYFDITRLGISIIDDLCGSVHRHISRASGTRHPSPTEEDQLNALGQRRLVWFFEKRSYLDINSCQYLGNNHTETHLSNHLSNHLSIYIYIYLAVYL